MRIYILTLIGVFVLVSATQAKIITWDMINNNNFDEYDLKQWRDNLPYEPIPGDVVEDKPYCWGDNNIEVSLTEQEEKLLNALKLAMKYLECSDDLKVTNLIYIPPSERLRQIADEIEQKDRDIKYIREVIKEFDKEEQ